MRAVDGVRAEQPGEEQHLGQQEQPDAELAGVELLLRRIEVMREVRIVPRGSWSCVPVAVRHGRRGRDLVRPRAEVRGAFLACLRCCRCWVHASSRQVLRLSCRRSRGSSRRRRGSRSRRTGPGVTVGGVVEVVVGRRRRASVHSSVVAPQGLAGAFVPFLRSAAASDDAR